MCKRYDPHVVYMYDSFKENMRKTAEENQHPMDMDHTVRVMAMLDSRCGRGSYSDYIRVPQAQRNGQARPYTDFLPVYNDTWTTFLNDALDPAKLAQLRLPAIPRA